MSTPPKNGTSNQPTPALEGTSSSSDELRLTTPLDSQFPPVPLAPLPPLRVSGFEILEELGIGGMGIVYRAVDLRLGREVALKVMRPTGGLALLDRFAIEARAMARLDHPHIVPILWAGEHDGAHYLVMKLLAGGTL